MLNAYPIMGKKKSFDICAAFLDGYPGAGQMITNGQPRDGAAFFYGVDESNMDAWQFVRDSGHEFYYADNSYIDQTRGTYFRVTKNALQHSGHGASDCRRFRALGVEVKPWQSGGHVVLCPQSDSFMRDIAGVSFDWTQKTVEALGNFTSRHIRVREWNRDKKAGARTLPDDLTGAHALVTWSSAAAVTAIINGVPIVATGPSAARPMSGDIADIEDLPRPEREQWLGLLADNQFTLSEFRDGFAWRSLNG